MSLVHLKLDVSTQENVSPRLESPLLGEASVDIVAIHSFEEDNLRAWTDPGTGKLWLRDFLPTIVETARVLTYGYDASADSFKSSDCIDTVQKEAQSLVAHLEADRAVAECATRPIIFVCHGVGGLIAKEALAYSYRSTSSQVTHLNRIFVSTYAILFFGTPHWCGKGGLVPGPPLVAPELSIDATTLDTIQQDFAHLMKYFRIYYFWEQVKTNIGGQERFVVEKHHAAPTVDNTERAGIDATYSGMIKFGNPNSSSYRTVIAALKRYCREAPELIAHRHQQADVILKQARKNEAIELQGLDWEGYIGTSKLNKLPNSQKNEYFYPPQVPIDYFIGRQDIFELLENALLHSGNSNSKHNRRRKFVVYGMGGSGKTHLCWKYATEHQEKYWGVFTIDATSHETAKQSFAEIGNIGKKGDVESAGKHWLSQQSEPWLLIVNNADNPDLNLVDMFPQGDRGHIIITTRNTYFREHANAGSVELQGLKEPEARHLLLKRAGIPQPWDASISAAANRIARSLGYLAIALYQAGTSIAHHICDLTDYLDFHNQMRSRRQTRSRSHSRSQSRSHLQPTESTREDHDTIFSTFDLSLELLEKKNTTSGTDAMEILKIICFYHFEHIPVDIFKRALENRQLARNTTLKSVSPLEKLSGSILSRLQPPLILPDFLKGSTDPPDWYRAREGLNELHALSLISFDDNQNKTFSLHPLIHAWARDRLSRGEEVIWKEIALNTLMETVLLLSEIGENPPYFLRGILPHLDECLKETNRPIRLHRYDGFFGGVQISFAKVFQPTLLLILREEITKAAKCGLVYAEGGRLDQAVNYLSMTRDILSDILGHTNDKTLTASLALSKLYWYLGDLQKAISLQEGILAARSKTCGPKGLQTLQAMNELGSSYWLNGQYREALETLQRTTDRMNEVLKPDHPHRLSALDNLGVVLGAWHRFNESEKLHREVLHLRKKQANQTLPDVIGTMSKLAMALLDLKRVNEAYIIMNEAYEKQKDAKGTHHPVTLWVMCNLAKIKIEQGALQEAEEMLLEGIAAAKRSIGDSHLGTLMGCGALAKVYSRQKRYEEAEELTLDTIEKLKHSRGEEHPDSVYAMWKLARLYEIRGKTEQAIRACEVALARVDKRLTREHPFGAKIEAKLLELQKMPLSIPEDSELVTGEHLEIKQESFPPRGRFKLRSQKTW